VNHDDKLMTMDPILKGGTRLIRAVCAGHRQCRRGIRNLQHTAWCGAPSGPRDLSDQFELDRMAGTSASSLTTRREPLCSFAVIRREIAGTNLAVLPAPCPMNPSSSFVGFPSS